MCPNCVTPWKCNGPHILRREVQSELDALREAVFINHSLQPADSPFNNTGRDICGTCLDGTQPADWPCPTFAALDAHLDGGDPQ